MKTLTILIFCLGLTLSSFSQNNAPIAVNDTIYIAFNDSTYIQQISGYPFMTNDSDPDGNPIYIDTAYYSGLGSYNDTLIILSPTFRIWRLSYIPPLNFYGMDSISYVIEDNGTPVMYDTATIYLFVKHQEYENLDLNNIKALFSLNSLFNDVVNSTSSFEVPKGSGSNTIYAANLWVAGKNQDSVFLDVVTYGSIPNLNPLTNFFSRSGPIMDSMYYKQYDYKWDRLWKITSNEINFHINNWSNAGYQPIEVIANWPAHGDTAKGQAFYLAPFVDINNDGIYNPYDGDYPKIKGQQAVYFIYNDANYFSSSQSGGATMRSETHYMAYAYNCSSDSAINNTIFLDYTIYNRSNLTYDSTYLGMWTDFAIGNPTDDYVGCDVARSSFYGYNGDANDENANGTIGYGVHPPAQGVTFLQGAKQDNEGIDNPFTQNIQDVLDSSGTPYAGLGTGFGDGIIDNEHWGMEHFIYYSNISVLQGYLQNANDYYNYLKGFWKDNTQMVYGGNGHVSGGGTIPAKYLFSGATDPLWYGTGGIATTPTNWTETGFPGDRRGLGSTGPFTFYPDSSISITLAFVFGRDYQTTGAQAGVVVMQERIDSIRSYFNTDFVSACGGTISVNEHTEKENDLLIYPNPFNNELTINYELKSNYATLEIYNLVGKKIKTQTITKNTTKINLADYPQGIYFITISDGTNRVSRKIVKQ